MNLISNLFIYTDPACSAQALYKLSQYNDFKPTKEIPNQTLHSLCMEERNLMFMKFLVKIMLPDFAS